MDIKRQQYLDQLIASQRNGLIKIITGIRRCGKSYLLFKLFHEYLNSQGISDDHIIEVALDDCLIREKVVTFRMVKLNLLLSIFLITK